MNSQNKAIKAHLEAGNSITQLEAYRMFECTRLAARIKDLKAAKLPIASVSVKKGRKRFSRYFLEKQC